SRACRPGAAASHHDQSETGREIVIVGKIGLAAVTAAATFCAGVLAACGGSAGGPERPGPTDAVKAGGALTIGAAQGIKTLNPVTKGNAWEQVLFSLLWDGLVKTGSDGKLQPDLATSWSSSADLKTWTFQLRPDVRFSNGKVLTPDDVVSTIKYYQNPDTVTQLKNNVAPIVSVRADEANTVVFTLRTPNALFPASIQMVKIVDTNSLASIAESPAVTGPFRVRKFSADDHLTLERNPSYFGPAPKLDRIEFVKAADSAAAVTALKAGDLDALWSVPLSQVTTVENSSGLTVVKPAVIGQYVSWEVDTTKAPFDNVRARQALAYATDQRAILKAAYFNQGIISTTNDPLPSNQASYGGRLTDYTYDLDKAKALFTAAGVGPGSTLVWWGVANQYPEWSTSAQILQASLAKIDIKLQITDTDIASWPGIFYPAGKSFPGKIIPNFQSYPADPAEELSFLLTGRCECNWNNAAFDTLYGNALATVDPAQRQQAWQRVQELVNEQVPIFVPLQFGTLTAIKRSVVGLWVDSGGNPHLEDAGLRS
ncbi:ABC transporter substrate-binding protein, partial [Frankia sp. Cj3]